MAETRCRVYHPDHREGIVLFTTEEVEEHLRLGWSEDVLLRDLQINDNKMNNLAKSVPDNGNEVKYCECGCGQVVKRRFVQGHSWKARKK